MMEDDTAKRYPTAEAALGAVGSLPVMPDWKTIVGSEIIRWEQTKGSRKHVVQWIRIPRHNKWLAWSEPLNGTKGRKKTLGGSDGEVSAKKAVSDLEDYLA